MKILLIQPVIFPPIKSIFGRIMYSYFRELSFLISYSSLQQVAAVTPSNHEIYFIDERFDAVEYDGTYDLVGITVLTPFALRAYKIADEFRSRGKTVVLGGYHPTAMPNEAKQHADSVVIGEAEGTWPQLLKDFENNNLKAFYKQEKPVDPNLIPPARRDIVKHNHFIDVVQATRGCPYGCEFCAVTNVEGRKLRKRPIENVISEIRSLDKRFFIFADSSMTIDMEYTKSLFRELIGLHKNFACFGNSTPLLREDEFLKFAKKAGCVNWNVGFESFSQKTINNIGKKTNKVEQYYSTVKNIHKHKMLVTGEFILGFDEDKKDNLKHLSQMIKNIKVDFAEINLLTPLPGTILYKKINEENRFLNKSWSDYTGKNIVFQPKNMSVEELYKIYEVTTKNFYSTSNSLRYIIKSMGFGIPCFLWSLQTNFLWAL